MVPEYKTIGISEKDITLVTMAGKVLHGTGRLIIGVLIPILCVVHATCTDLGSWDQLLAMMKADSWFDSSWNTRIKLSFLNGGQNEDLLDFPVLVVLDPVRIDYTDFNADGSDIRFIDTADTSAPLPHEIESWTPGGNSYIWVRAPTIDGASNSDYIWLYFGNPAATSAENPAAVWNDRYVGVWHLNGSFGDSSLYGNHGTGNLVGTVTGPVGGAGSFNGVSSHIEIADSPSLDISGSLTLNAWIRKNVDGDRIIVSKYDKGMVDNARSYDLGFDRAGHVGRSYVTVSEDGALHPGGILELTPGSAIANFEWHYIAGVYDNSNSLNIKLYIYLDGLLDNETISDQTDIFLSNESVLIGAMWEDGVLYGFWDGYIDEVRISDTPRSADWIAAQYLTMTDSFVSFGSVENY
jgi:hypothetical protein